MKSIAGCALFAGMTVGAWYGLRLLERATFEGLGNIIGLVAVALLVLWHWAWRKWGRGKL